MNRRIDDIGKKNPQKHTERQMLIALLLFIILVGTIFGLIIITKFVGYVVNYYGGQAGYVYELVLEYHQCAELWAGVYGVALSFPGVEPEPMSLSSCELNNENLLFDCLQPGMQNIIMASLAPKESIDFSTLTAASVDDVDTYLNTPGTNVQSANRTFTQQLTFTVSEVDYGNVPGTYTKEQNTTPGATSFDIGVLKDGDGNLIYITHIAENVTRGFNNKLYNYQMILPIRNETNPVYYFFTDPAYVCPSGEGVLPNSGNVTGNVTDNSGSPLSDVIVVVANKNTLSNSNGEYNMTVTSGDYYIFAIKSGYQTYQSNVTVYPFNTTVHNIIMVAEAIPNPNTGVDVGPGTSDNTDVGPGEDDGRVNAIPIIEQPKRIEGVDYVISISQINRKLVIGNFLQEIVSFYSYKKGVANLQFSIEGENLSKIVKLDKTSMSIFPNTNDQLMLTVFGEGEPGIYNGSLVIDGDLKEKIPIRIELLEKDRLQIESLLILLDIEDRSAFANQKLKFKTDMHNLLNNQEYPVVLLFAIQNSKGETVWADKANVYLQTSFSLLKSAQLPSELPTGDYVLRVTAQYLGVTSSASQTFSVILPFYEQVYFGLKVWLWIVILSSLLIASLIGWGAYRYVQSKKRYSAKVEYSELPKPTGKAAFVGKIAETEHKTYFDLEQFKVHTIVAGATGGGKSVSSQVIVEEALLKNLAVIVFDPTAQWSGMLRKATDKNMLKLYPNFGMKPAQARAFNGNVRQITNALEVIDIKKYIKPGEIQILALNKLDPKDIDIFVANSIREVFHANFSETPEIRLLLVYDEVHRLLPKFGGSGEGFLQIERGCREFRKWGVGILMISQVLADFVGQIKANINTEIQMRTRDEGDLDRIATKYGKEVLQGLVKASVGTGMVENPTYNRGRPYFIAFRPLLHNTQRLSDDELEKYNKFNEQIDDIQYQLEQLEEEKQDVFDLKLQLKLALDKVKSGNFNMVDIYLQEVIPRVQKTWDKLGKKPKKREVKLIDANALREEMKKAEESRKQFEKDNKKPDAAAGPAAEKKKVPRYEKQVPISKALNFSNGVSVTSLQELADVMPNITGQTFKNHVSSTKNDIADWVEKSVKHQELADKLRAAKTNADFVKIIEEDKAKNNKPVDAEDVPEAAPTPAPATSAQTSPAPSSSPSTATSSADSTSTASSSATIPPAAPTNLPTNPPTTLESISPEESVAWVDLKKKLSDTADIDTRVASLEKGVAKYPDDINIAFSLALHYHKKKEYVKAEQQYRNLLQKDPSNTKAMYYYGGMLKTQKRYAESLAMLRKYVDIKKNDPRIKDLIAKIEAKNK